MALYHIHNSGKHVNKKAADNFRNQKQMLLEEKKTQSFSCTAENTNFERKSVL